MPVFDFALTLNRAITDDEIEALYEACHGDLDIETGPRGTIVAFCRDGPNIRFAAMEAHEQVRTVIGRGWMLHTDIG